MPDIYKDLGWFSICVVSKTTVLSFTRFEATPGVGIPYISTQLHLTPDNLRKMIETLKEALLNVDPESVEAQSLRGVPPRRVTILSEVVPETSQNAPGSTIGTLGVPRVG